MDIITIDTETFYSREFSLSKMTTEAYVRDPRFEVIGASIKVNDEPAHWYSGDDVGGFLHSLDYSDKAILCHNTAFDGAILAWHFGIKPRLWLDTLSMARPFHQMTVGGSLAKLSAHYRLGAKGTEVVAALGKRRADFTPEELTRYGRYCVNDANLTKALFDKLKVGFPAGEVLVINQALRMYTEPVIELDAPLLRQHLEAVRARKNELMTSLGQDMERETLMSNEKFAGYLKTQGVEPPTKVSAKTGRVAWAFAKTDKEFTDLLEHPDDRVQAAVAARLGVKSTLEETRTEALIGVAERGALPIMLNYYGAHTGRFCLVGDTQITVIRDDGVLDITISELLPDDLVWDGEEFVAHSGLLDQGEREVMTYDGITGTPDHPVFCDEVEGTVELRTASERGYTITGISTAPRPRADSPAVARVYDIANCGPRNRFVANGKLVHNSGGDRLNLQNLPSRDGKNTIRRALKAPAGHVLVACDSSQIEARIVAWLAGQEDLVQAFREKRDVYSEFASEVYRRPITKADKVERFVGKTCILGLGYYMGDEKLCRTLEIGAGGISAKVSIEESKRIVRLYRAKNHKIGAFWQKCEAALAHMTTGVSGHLHAVIPYDSAGITLPNKFKIQYPALRSGPNGFEYISDARTTHWMKIYGGKVTENIIQALAALVIREQMVEIGNHYKVVFQVHDEIIIIAPEAEAKVAQAKIEAVMSTAPKWAPDLPVACESGYATNYGDA